ncbi:MAG: VWA domain-containing protein [Candidatus Rokuibacteriota bacterium]
MFYRYSRWDGSQRLDLDADALMSAMADDLLHDGDPWRALRRLMQQGMRGPEGQRMPGLRDMLERLRQRRQQRLDRYDLGSSLDDIKRKLDDVLATERAGIERRRAETREGARRGDVPRELARKFERLAARNTQALDDLPPDPPGRIRGLQRYDFVDPEARRKFEELLDSLRQQMLQPFMQGMQSALKNMTPGDLARMREMLQDLNRMLRERAEGGEPDFEAFKQKWGQHFPGVESLDQLLEQMGRQMATMQSLMQSLTPEQRAQLDEMMRSLLLQDERLEAAMRQLAANLNDLLPLDELAQRYPFQGDEEVTLAEAMRLMDELQQMDALERELRGVRALEDLEGLDADRVEKLLGEDAREDLERLRELARRLEEAGYLEREGEELKLTARGIRKIADKALRDIFARLARDRFGGHAIERRGAGGDQTDETKAYEFGDAFLLDMKGTVLNAVTRRGPGTPVRLAPDDFEVHRTELRTQAATVVMLDMSRSMLNNGYFLPAKKVALALSSLIRGQFPRDALYIVGFSLYAREFKKEELPTLSWSEWNVGTNMHHGFMLARRLLARHQGGTRQILMVTDGEPTAHMEGDVADFSYPPMRRTLEETLREVRRCTRESITINTFMLERSPWLVSFVQQMTRINRGRAFFAAPDRLGEYLVVDYVTSRRRAMR